MIKLSNYGLAIQTKHENKLKNTIMKANTKKMAAEITSALSEATLVKSSGKKIMKKIDAVAKRMANKITKKIDSATGKTQKSILKKEQKKAEKTEKKIARKSTPQVTA
jgi:hypothetical protein